MFELSTVSQPKFVLVNGIILLMESVCQCPKVIPLSGTHCTAKCLLLCYETCKLSQRRQHCHNNNDIVVTMTKLPLCFTETRLIMIRQFLGHENFITILKCCRGYNYIFHVCFIFKQIHDSSSHVNNGKNQVFILHQSRLITPQIMTPGSFNVKFTINYKYFQR